MARVKTFGLNQTNKQSNSDIMSLSVKGIISHIGEVVQVSDTFKKRDIVLKVQSGQYENDNAFQLVQDRCNLADSLAEGQEVEAFFNIRSKEAKGRWFTNLDIWKIETAKQETHTVPAKPFNPPVAHPPTAQGEDIDDLPF